MAQPEKAALRVHVSAWHNLWILSARAVHQTFQYRQNTLNAVQYISHT